MRNASKACCAIMSPFFIEEMSDVLDDDKKVKHMALATKMDEKIDDAKFFKQLNKPKFSSEFDPAQLDWAYGPVVQSGGKYDLKLSAAPDDNYLHAGVILAGFGLRYKTYCAIIARTYLVHPNKTQESNYKLLLSVHQMIIKEIREGVVVKDIYNKALHLIKTKKPELEKHFLKNVGAGIGIETRDSTLLLNAKNNRTLKDGMTICVTTGLTDIINPTPQDKKSGVYSLLLSDTVRVLGQEAVVFTSEAPSDQESISFYFKVSMSVVALLDAR
jgi:nucleosome binding factor SPN SPT16 subunit